MSDHPTPSPTPLGTCDNNDRFRGDKPHPKGDLCINWTPEPSPGTERKEGRASEIAEPLVLRPDGGEVDRGYPVGSSAPLSTPSPTPETRSKNLMVRLTPETYDKLKGLADSQERSVAQEARLAIRIYLEDDPR